MEKYRNSWNFYGHIISGSGKQGYRIKLDDLPANDNIVYVKCRTIVKLVDVGEEEVECDHVSANLDVIGAKDNEKRVAQ